ncbi:LVIVD repeat-containing protein [Melghirimyces profundicolus]|uniref:LVIVD repeat-containing protein n=1 Tax=Melghirimyces profundicolus TaxID=1242148 RepID=A0A2T6C8B0_9BACL|nr:hypothetical protein [Melghirimyces profundicolus]PTX64554.1 LVIVD repeat-containing protein [Melghirimyces profundicolus]
MKSSFFKGFSLILSVVVFAFLPGAAVVEGDGLEGDIPLLSSDNVRLVGQYPGELLISASFASDQPYMYANTLSGITVYDISEPTRPVPVGHLPISYFENENANLAEREDGTKFLLVAIDLYGVTPTHDDPSLATDNEIAVVDVTDPTHPHVTSRVKTTTRTHTVTCVNPECTYAYTSGSKDDAGNPAFSIINLKDPAQPFEEKVYPSSVGATGHDWDIDASGVAWHTGLEGTVAYDISDPLNPKVLNATDERGLNGTDWNNFIHHNTLRPHAKEFKNRGKGELETDESTERTADQVRKGETLMVTEEDYLHPGTCEDEGSFQTWQVQRLDKKAGGTDPSRIEPGTGTIEPLDHWNSKILNTDVNTQAGFICSAHYFDYHQAGFVAIGFYQQGVRILDVRDPTEIKQVGYWFAGVQEAWGAHWVPERDENGRITGDMSNLVYVSDPTRGLDILEVDLPGASPDKTKGVSLPITTDMIQVTADGLSEAMQRKMSHHHDH